MQKSVTGAMRILKPLDSKCKRILFATVPADGHFNPLTGLAVHLQKEGHDVRWYTSPLYAGRLSKLNIQHYPFVKALDVNGDNLEEVFPQRKKIKGLVKKLCFDMINGFIHRSVEYYEDIKAIQQTFPFDIVVCDCIFTAIPFIKEKLRVPVITIGVLPLTETSKDLAPAGLGLMPSNTFFGGKKQDVLRFITDKILFRKPTQIMKSLLQQHGIAPMGSNPFDMLVRKSTLLLQSGTPGFEYKRSDLGSNVRFIGPLLPYKNDATHHKWHHEKLNTYKKVILVTQGTVEKDTTKLLVPTLEAFKGSDCLVVATTGGSHTRQLQMQYPYDNIIIEDFVPFADIMPYADVYVTNGGYGGVMLSILNHLPIVTAGIHEGKKEINARINYFGLGIDMNTERPSELQVKDSVEKVLSDSGYLNNVRRLADEFAAYNPYDLCTQYINECLTSITKYDFTKV